MQNNSEKYNLETCCHADGLPCTEKQQRIEMWSQSVENITKMRSNPLAYPMGNILTKCPQETCSRNNCKQR